MTKYDYDAIVVGVGFAGAVLAERLTNELQWNVLVIDKRQHVAGTAYDHPNEHGVMVHDHGAHVFHTNSSRVTDYLGRFTNWQPYEHRVQALVNDTYVPMPINRTTVNKLMGTDLQTELEVEEWFARERELIPEVKTSEDQVVARVGRRMFDLLYRDYTKKHWGVDASELHASVAGRLPFRTNDDDRYFTDWFQAQPAEGYTRMFERMLKGIDVQLGMSWEAARHCVNAMRVFYTGPIDEFFGHPLGRLPFRSVRWEHEHLRGPGPVLPAAVVNVPDHRTPWTRAIEWCQLTGQEANVSTVSFEFPSDQGEPHYPVPSEENWELSRAYRRLAQAEAAHVTFLGRLGAYRYMTMDQTVAHALKVFDVEKTDYLADYLRRPTSFLR